MIRLYTFSPNFTLWFAAIFQSLMMVVFVIVPKEHKSDKKAFEFAQNFGLGLYFLFGLIFLDTGICWLAGQWMYADWRFQLPSVILLIIIGIQYCFSAMLIKPRITDLIFFAVASPIVLSLIHIHLTLVDDLKDGVIYVLGIILVLQVVYVIFWGLNRFIDKKPSRKDKKKYLWDFSKQFRRIFNRTSNIVLWAVMMTEALLKLVGSSLFIWGI